MGRAAEPSIGDGPVLVRPAGSPGAPAKIWSQSAIASVTPDASDAVLVVATASTDPEVGSLGLLADS